jgi:hypothetical protein
LPRTPPKKVSIPGIPVKLCDGPGLEVEGWAERLNQIDADVLSQKRLCEPRKQYVAVLLVVHYRTRRFEAADIGLVAKVIRGWHLPLGIVLTNFEAPPRKYEGEPTDEFTMSIKKQLAGSDARFNTIPFFLVNSVVDENTELPVRGFERLATGLKELVERGLQQVQEGFDMNVANIINSEASDCGAWSGGLFFMPFASTIVNSIIPKRMIVRLLKLFKVEEPVEPMAELLLDRYRNGWETGGLVVADVVKAIPVAGWLIGGLGTGLGCKRQTRLLGLDVQEFLCKLPRSGGLITHAAITKHLFAHTP